jgi:hypothetical protein
MPVATSAASSFVMIFPRFSLMRERKAAISSARVLQLCDNLRPGKIAIPQGSPRKTTEKLP